MRATPAEVAMTRRAYSLSTPPLPASPRFPSCGFHLPEAFTLPTPLASPGLRREAGSECFPSWTEWGWGWRTRLVYPFRHSRPLSGARKPRGGSASERLAAPASRQAQGGSVGGRIAVPESRQLPIKAGQGPCLVRG